MELSHLQKLNEEQYTAAKTIYGPVMVLAGPGTGKTELISARTANMLISDTGITPNMILAMTFTEAGVIAIRKRLLSMIGVEAYKIPIHTFHSFCNEIIQNNPDYFGLRNHEPVTELERIEIAYRIIEELPASSILKRSQGDVYYESRRLLNLWSFMKEENFDETTFNDILLTELRMITEAVDEIKNKRNEIDEEKIDKEGIKLFIENLSETGKKYVYTRKSGTNKAGYLKEHIVKKDLDHIQKLREGGGLLSKYNQELNNLERYDFSDMIHFVLNAWKDDNYFLLSYQERYQFLLLDEFQDTNGSQLELVNQLMAYWPKPNVFCVGDVDQTIYEFSGARVKNMIDFTDKYQPLTVGLVKNYRSTQQILNLAQKIIVLNEDRIENGRLVAEAVSDNFNPVCYYFPNPHVETAWIISEIKRLQSEGEDLSDVAIIYRKHRLADNLIQQLEVSEIDYNIHRSINVLDTVYVRQIVNMLQYVMSLNENNMVVNQHLFFEILHYDCFNNDINKIHAYYIQLNDKDFRSRKPKDIIETESIFENIVTDYHNAPLLNLLYNIINETGLLTYILNREDKIQILQYINTFFSWVKGEAFKNPSITGKELVLMIEKMKDNGLYLSVIDLHSFNQGINLLSAHGAKGLEFKHVYIMAANKNEWEGSRSGNMDYKLPESVTQSGEENKLESNRRLFYVAMTRAKTHLHISYSEKNMEGKDLEATQFIYESEIEPVEGPTVKIEEYLITALKKPDYRLEINKDIIAKRLENFRLSASAMNKYQECGLAFYYENIVKVPFIAHPALIYGNACHIALKNLFDQKKKKITLSFDQFFQVFLDYMKRNLAQMTEYDYQLRIDLGKKTLKFYYDKIFPEANYVTLNEFHLNRVLIEGIPCTGDIDKLEFLGANNHVKIKDYKTGKPENARKNIRRPTEKDPNGGDYWKQGGFYGLLLKNWQVKPWTPSSVEFEVLGDGEVVVLEPEYNSSDEEHIKKMIIETYNGIMNQDFKGCGKPECKWCNMNSLIH